MHRTVIRNEDATPIWTTIHADRAISRALAEQWLLGFTNERRVAAGVVDCDEGWLQTLCDNGFFSIAEYEE